MLRRKRQERAPFDLLPPPDLQTQLEDLFHLVWLQEAWVVTEARIDVLLRLLPVTTLALGAIMDAIAATLVAQSVESTAQVFAWPVPSFTPPCLIVGYPEKGATNLDLTFKRGGIQATFPLWAVVGRAIDRSARDTLSNLIDGGSTTIKTALESGGGTLGGVVASTHVLDPTAENISDSVGAEYLAARFDVEVLA